MKLQDLSIFPLLVCLARVWSKEPTCRTASLEVSLESVSGGQKDQLTDSRDNEAPE